MRPNVNRNLFIQIFRFSSCLRSKQCKHQEQYQCLFLRTCAVWNGNTNEYGKRIKRNSIWMLWHAEYSKENNSNGKEKETNRKSKRKIYFFILKVIISAVSLSFSHFRWEYIPNSNKKKLLKHEFRGWVNENRGIECDVPVPQVSHTHTEHVWMWVWRETISLFTHETKWENYYSKPHDEHARILCIFP